MTSNVRHTVTIGPASMRALRAFLSNPTGTLRINGRIVFEASETGGVVVSTDSAPQPVLHDSRCTALAHYTGCPDWRLPY